jgi:hypothetical protein
MATEKQVYHFTAEVANVEIRKVEDIDASFEGKDGKTIESHYIKLTCDVGEDMDRVFFKDKDMANLDKYKRGMVGTVVLRIDVEEGFGSKAKFLVVDFREDDAK